MTIAASNVKNGVAVIRIDNPPVNALSQATRQALVAQIQAANADLTVKAIVITGAGRAFSAGADITEFKAGRLEPFLPDVIGIIEASPKPVVAAINGLALGGGLEVALGCHYRVAAESVRQLGLPEVKIGVLPGAGGTQRLPRIVGIEAALDVIVSGQPIDAKKAEAIGLVDRVVAGDVVAAAIAHAEELVAAGKGPRRSSELPVPAVAADTFDKRRAALGRHPSGPVAPKACIDAVELITKIPFAEGMKRERAMFGECLATPYAKALQYAFFAERQAGVIPDIGPDVKPRAVKTLGVIGAGTMGTGIALAFLAADLPVTVVEMKQDALDKGVARIKETIEGLAKRGRISADVGLG